MTGFGSLRMQENCIGIGYGNDADKGVCDPEGSTATPC